MRISEGADLCSALNSKLLFVIISQPQLEEISELLDDKGLDLILWLY
jgi:hypothetical protein